MLGKNGLLPFLLWEKQAASKSRDKDLINAVNANSVFCSNLTFNNQVWLKSGENNQKCDKG